MKKNLWIPVSLAALLCALLLTNCAGSRTYLLSLTYDPAKVPVFTAGAAKPVTVAVYNFHDTRSERVFVGRRVYRDGMLDFYKPDGGTVEQIVTQSFVRLLEKAGFKVVPVNRYLDPDKEDFQNIPGDAAFGGKIEALWVEAKSGLATTETQASMRLRVHWGLVKERTWISKTIEGTASETDRPLYKWEHAQAKLNEVFRDGLDKLLKDEALLREKLLQGK